ncbi:hypothetical protein GOV14_02775 [Candidatus Pacearchaeota archaeon]|nr:hypothetical protein [Candidatus Pacearchaeota archaeon]
MSIEYKLEITGSGKYKQLECDPNSKAIIRSLWMSESRDCIAFERQNGDGSTYGSNWGLDSLNCFKELKRHKRIMDMSPRNLKKFATRVYELLYSDINGAERYVTGPKIDETRPEYKQILREMKTLQREEKRLISSGELTFSENSSKEFTCI